MSLKIYLDESGTDDDPNVRVMTLGGCLAPLDAWEPFEEEWAALLSEFGVRELHMKHLWHLRGEYEEWTKQKRDRFLDCGLTIMESYVSAYVGSRFQLDEYRDLVAQTDNEGKPLFQVPKPYYECVQNCIHATMEYQELENRPPTERIEFVLDRNDEHKFWTLRIFDQLKRYDPDRLGSMAFDDSERVPQLQAADLIAWELRRHCTTTGEARQTFERIRRKKCYFYV